MGLAKKYKIVRKSDFDRIWKNGKGKQTPILFTRILNNDLGFTRFGIIVGSKVSNKAVDRNKIRRQINEVVASKFGNIEKGLDVLVVAKPEILGDKFGIIKKHTNDLLRKSGLTSK